MMSFEIEVKKSYILGKEDGKKQTLDSVRVSKER
jgi:hypothetical protein